MFPATVLLVDDEEDFTALIAERLAARGMTVDVASDGPGALEKAGMKSYDAVVLDLAMPGMDGIETLKLLLAQNSDLQVILLTGHATVSKGIEAIRSGAMEFLEKPVKFETLIEKILEAGTNRVQLTQQRMEEDLSRILRRKSW